MTKALESKSGVHWIRFDINNSPATMFLKRIGEKNASFTGSTLQLQRLLAASITIRERLSSQVLYLESGYVARLLAKQSTTSHSPSGFPILQYSEILTVILSWNSAGRR